MNREEEKEEEERGVGGVSLFKGTGYCLPATHPYLTHCQILKGRGQDCLDANNEDRLHKALLTLNFLKCQWNGDNSCWKALDHRKNWWIKSAYELQGCLDISMENRAGVMMGLRLCLCLFRWEAVDTIKISKT